MLLMPYAVASRWEVFFLKIFALKWNVVSFACVFPRQYVLPTAPPRSLSTSVSGNSPNGIQDTI